MLFIRRVCTCRKGANETYMHKVVNLYSKIMLDLKHPPSSYSTGKDKKTKCRDEYHAALKNPSSGRFKPRCNLDGTYAKVQCSGSDCYCADKDGNEIMGTKTPMVAGKPVCEKPGMCFWPRFFPSAIPEGNEGKQFMQVKTLLKQRQDEYFWSQSKYSLY